METPNISRAYPSVTGARAHSCRPGSFDSPTSRHHAGCEYRDSLTAPIGARHQESAKAPAAHLPRRGKEKTVNQISGRVMRAMKWRSQVWIVALAASMLAACSSTGSPAVHGASGSPAAPTSTTAKQAAAHGVEAAITDIPWSQVGP